MAANRTKTQKARLQRPSPTAHAAEHKGEVKRGHDGRSWRSEPDKNGVFHWKKVNPKRRVVMKESDYERLRRSAAEGLAIGKPGAHRCAHCKKLIKQQPVSFRSGDKTTHYHAQHAHHHKRA